MDGNTYYRESDIYVNPDIEGYLTEKKLMRNARTWCSLQGAKLYLQKSQGSTIQIYDMAREVQSVRKLTDPCHFEISTKKVKHTFICSSPAECTDWVTALQSAMTLKSNGFGRSVFHSPTPVFDDEENAYALPTDDTDAHQKPSKDLPVESVYDDIEIGNPLRYSAPKDIEQSFGKTEQNRKSERPPLPSMRSRRAKPMQQKEDYVEPSSAMSYQGTQSAEGEYSDISSLQPDPSKTYQEGEYTDGFTPQDSESAQDLQSEYADGVSGFKPSASTSDTPVTLRNRSSLRSSKNPSIKITENGIDECDSSKDQEDGNDAEVVAGDNAFAELKTALTFQSIPDPELQNPLTENDYLPVKELHEFLANNSQLLHGTYYNHLMVDPMEDPVADLKVFLEQMQL